MVEHIVVQVADHVACAFLRVGHQVPQCRARVKLFDFHGNLRVYNRIYLMLGMAVKRSLVILILILIVILILFAGGNHRRLRLRLGLRLGSERSQQARSASSWS